jgi:hypothetical protein
MTASSSVPSPAQQGSIVKITDEGIASYIEFPKDTIFMEALAQNASFNSGIAYVPVQRLVAGVKESHLYTIVPGMKEATHVAGPIAAPDGSTDVTIFGCHLTTAGILYLCAFNRNSILALDLTSLPVQAPPLKITCQLEIPHIRRRWHSNASPPLLLPLALFKLRVWNGIQDQVQRYQWVCKHLLSHHQASRRSQDIGRGRSD